MSLVPASLEKLATELGRLPGIGPKTAQRLAFHCMRAPRESVEQLSAALLDLRDQVRSCSRCFFIAEADLCGVCSNPRRDPAQICVVEEALDVLTIERSGEFSGLYHVLEGAISPIDGVGPEQLRVAELVERVRGGEVREVVVATDPDVEGEATAFYLAERLAPLGITVTRLAHGLPAGSDLQYADELTVARAFSGRRAL
ncbi:MAG TPA: recombination mediator RecR [Streptosporangiaceae bacterium]|nr:recombination mediator RecR [Streptosporangiaceae bacterium]